MEWQPIETAPKDGSKFIMARFADDGHEPDYEVAQYDPHTWPEYVPVGDGLYRKEERVLGEWRNDNPHRMTHWMPLPAPPEA